MDDVWVPDGYIRIHEASERLGAEKARGFLFSGDLKAVRLADDGQLWDVPQRAWGAVGADAWLCWKGDRNPPDRNSVHTLRESLILRRGGPLPRWPLLLEEAAVERLARETVKQTAKTQSDFRKWLEELLANIPEGSRRPLRGPTWEEAKERFSGLSQRHFKKVWTELTPQFAKGGRPPKKPPH